MRRIILFSVLMIGVGPSACQKSEPVLAKGPEMDPRIAEALDGLVSTDVAVRSRAAGLLREIGPEAIPHLVDRVEDRREDRQKRALSIRILGETLPRTPDVLRTLCEAILDSDAFVSEEAFSALEGVGEEGLPFLLENLRSGSSHQRARCGSLIASIGGPSVAPLLELTGDPELSTRRAALVALAKIESLRDHREAVLPVLLETLNDPVRQARDAAKMALTPFGEAAVPALVRILDEKHPTKSPLACEALGRIGMAALGPLQERMRAPDPELRTAAAFTLGKFPEVDETVIRLLADGIADTDNRVRLACIGALRSIGGTTVKPAITQLVEALSDPDPHVRQAAADVLPRISPAVVRRILPALEDPDPDVRLLAITTLGRMSREAGAAIPALESRMEDPDEAMRTKAARVLRQIRRQQPRRSRSQ